MFGELEESSSAIGEIVLSDLEKSCSAIWRNHARRFGEIVLGDLEKSCSAILDVLVERIGGHRSVAYISLTVVEAYDEGKNVEKLWRPELY